MANFQPRGNTRKPMREFRDTRKPLYIVFILDTSSSMSEHLTVSVSEGETKRVRKIEELNIGLADALNSLRRFENNNVLYKVYYQIIELNSYGKALFPDFVPLSMQSESICFEANGVTCLENSLNTLMTFLDPKHMPGCNRAVNVILMSDGYPTDVEGYVEKEEVYKKTIDDFKGRLEKDGLKPNVDLYSIGVGEDACKDMLQAFADKGHFYAVAELESLAQKLDFVTRKSLTRMTSRIIRPASLPQPQPSEENANDSLNETVATREIDVTKCLGGTCAQCVGSCSLSAIRNESGFIVIHPDLCVGCGECDGACPVGAIVLAEEGGCEGLL